MIAAPGILTAPSLRVGQPILVRFTRYSMARGTVAMVGQRGSGEPMVLVRLEPTEAGKRWVWFESSDIETVEDAVTG